MEKILKKIVVNARFLTQKMTGVQRFAFEICRQLKKSNVDIVFYCPGNIQLEDEFKELEAEVVGRCSGHIWEQIELPFILWKKYRRNYILLNLCNLAPLFTTNKIITLHDIAFNKFPDSFSFKFRFFYTSLMPFLLKTSKMIFTVSEFSKEQISDFYNIDKSKILVTNNAASSCFYGKKNPSSQGKFILAVSSLNKQKNFSIALSAMKFIEDKSIILKVVGGHENSFQRTSFDSSSSVEFLGRVSDNDLFSLYSTAEAFISPSLYEGFGIPLLEAQNCGCPIVVSNIPTYREVCGLSALYFNPLLAEDLASKLNLLLSDSTIKSHMVNLGLENTKRFSWEKSAEHVLVCLRSFR